MFICSADYFARDLLVGKLDIEEISQVMNAAADLSGVRAHYGMEDGNHISISRTAYYDI